MRKKREQSRKRELKIENRGRKYQRIIKVTMKKKRRIEILNSQKDKTKTNPK